MTTVHDELVEKMNIECDWHVILPENAARIAAEYYEALDPEIGARAMWGESDWDETNENHKCHWRQKARDCLSAYGIKVKGE